MSHPPVTPEERFAAIVETLVQSPDVTPPFGEIQSQKRFGSDVLKIHNKVFAMLVKGRLVVKLPRQRVDMLIASGDGERFDPGHGRLMREWLALAPTSQQDWLPLAREAMTFVNPTR